MQRGEIRWYGFPHPDKRRPVLILTRDPAIDVLGELTIAPIGTTIRNISSEVVLTQAEGMPRECAAQLDHVQTVSKGRIGERITTLSPRRWQEVRAALLYALGF